MVSGTTPSTKIGHFLLFIFALTTCFGFFYFVKGFLKVKDMLPNRANFRFDPLKTYFPDSPEINEYITKSTNRPLLYKQVLWLLIDMLPIYVVKPNPNTRIFYELLKGRV